ncbi:MAG: hypothetical protein ACK5IC_06015 [Moheibacter sp.]
MAIIEKAKNMTIVTKNKETIIVGGKMEIIAEKITITATKGDLSLNSNKKVIIEGKNGGVKFGKYEKPISTEKVISEVMWMNSKMENKISNARVNELLSLKVKTENYNVGDIVSLTIKEQENQDKTIQLMGYVQDDGYTLLQEVMYVDSINLNKNSNLA